MLRAEPPSSAGLWPRKARARLPLALVLAAMAAGPAGCVLGGGPDIGTDQLSLDAYCQADVQGVGTLDVESDYLPQVVTCENGGASFAALESQAVAARSFLYYKLQSGGSIGDGQGDQVYTCGASAGDDQRRAVSETSGQILTYQGTLVAAFFVAGALQMGPDCTGGTNDPTATERYVTYNMGKSGADVEQTSLGYISPTNDANRGCQSQNGAHCLSDAGWDYDSILRFYYGDDIEVTTAQGPCVVGSGPGPDAGPGPGATGDLEGGCSAAGAGNHAGAAVPALLLGLALMVAGRTRSRRRRA